MGGGGRGMRVVPDAAQLDALLEEARGEAHSAFGDASVFLEKYLPRARHLDRKSTRLNSSHGYISYAVFCLKKKQTRPRSVPRQRARNRLDRVAHPPASAHSRG